MRECLQAGHSLVLFPEGSRGQTGQIAPFQAGVGRLALEFPEIPVVPVYLSGPERAFPKTSAVPVPLANRVLVGPPVQLNGTGKQIAAALEAMTRELAQSEAAGRHRRTKAPRTVTTLAVLGIDGSGKSTLARELAERLSCGGRIALITDDVEFYESGRPRPMQPLLLERLREAIGRRAKTADSLESYKIPKLAELLLRDRVVEGVRRWYAPDAIVMDGAPLINITAWAGLYRQEGADPAVCASILRILSGRERHGGEPQAVLDTFPEMAALRRLHMARLELPDALLFLDVEPSVSIARIRSRGQDQQVHETKDKLVQLRQGYRRVCEVVDRELGVPVRTLDGDAGLQTVVDNALAVLEGIDVPAARHLTDLAATETTGE
jgi:thymidylate kinase